VRATFIYGHSDVRVEDVPEPTIIEPTDAIVRVTLACVCGSDLHRYHAPEPSPQGRPMGHELIGVVETVGDAVATIATGDLVISPFAMSDNTCPFCVDGFHTACQHGAFFGEGDVGGAQADKVRIKQAAGTLVPIPGVVDEALLPSLLTLSDVYLGPHPCAPYIEEAIPLVLDGTIDPGRVFDAETSLVDVAEAYRLMESREALKVLVRP